MAWPEDLRLIIEVLEDGFFVMAKACGYLKAQKNDPVALDIAAHMDGVLKVWQLIRMQQWKQLGLWAENKAKKKGKE